MTTAVIVPAAGRGDRLGPGLPKALREIGGVPMLVHAVRSVARARNVSLVVVAAPAEGVAEVRALLRDHDVEADVEVVAGGAERQASVGLALHSLGPEYDVVLVHDAARPLVPVELVELVAATVAAGAPAVVPGLPVTDTVKQVDGTGTVTATLDRSALRAIQTPQGFRRDLLQRAHDALDPLLGDATDDAGLVERAGVPITVVPGAEEAFKVTRPLDLVLAEAVLQARRSAGVR